LKITRAHENIKIDILHFADGDTVFCRVHCNHCGLSRESYIRLAGIESHEPRGSSRIQAREIAERWDKILAGTKAELIPHQSGSDKYGRIVGTILINGTSLAESLIKAGDAWAYTYKKKTT
jgi:endonuclease YncB( thermonuclease family)